MEAQKSRWQLLGYCPGCKNELYYNWYEDLCESACSCDRHTNCRQLLQKREEEEENG